jgi:hypothetical protein
MASMCACARQAFVAAVAEYEGAASDQQLLWSSTGVVGIALVGKAAPGSHIGPAFV